MLGIWVMVTSLVALDADVAFHRDVRPILADACFHCHGPDAAKRKGKLRLDTEDGARAAVTPGDPEMSELFRRITAAESTERMPPSHSGRKLTDSQVAVLKRWIQQGALWQKHWSLLTPERPRLRDPGRGDWSRNAIDDFVSMRHRQENLRPSPEADRATLLRRVSLDLTGLPPTPEDLAAFADDHRPDAYERAVERLLGSPRYGERMVSEWLDASRYADTNGFQGDRTRMNWPWRDWVIDALNENMPFDQFTIEQFAGDLLPNAMPRNRVATGFHRNHMLNGEGGRILEEARVDYVVDRVDTTAAVWLGLTLGCARCHDHKYDAFTQKDYYRLFAYFNQVPESGAVEGNGLAKPWLRYPTAEQERLYVASQAAREAAEKRVNDVIHGRTLQAPSWQSRVGLGGWLPVNLLIVPEHLLIADDWRAAARVHEDAKAAVRQIDQAIPLVMVMEDRAEPRDTFLLRRGAYDQHGEKVLAGVPDWLPDAAPRTRLDLARWLVDRRHPLTARVTVNRMWQLFFGTGLVRTAEDFGSQGEWPSHPELLDWLAVEFMTSGWDVKHMHRLIVTSATYRQSSRAACNLWERDPENRLLARGPRFRMASGMIRDQALAISGLLSERLGGPPVRPYQPPGIWEEMTFGFIKYEQDKGPNLYRRSVYTFWRRTIGPTTLFDAPARQVCSVRQTRTNTPLQALTLLNDLTFVEAARVVAERVLREVPADSEARVKRLFQLATARSPTDGELELLLKRLARLRDHYASPNDTGIELAAVGESPRNQKLDSSEVAAWTSLALLILNLDEVICKE
jgi:hypothetical protein